jgi:hypothetical protein
VRQRTRYDLRESYFLLSPHAMTSSDSSRRVAAENHRMKDLAVCTGLDRGKQASERRVEAVDPPYRR